MVTLVCPTCKTENLALPTEQAVHCRSCGQSICVDAEPSSCAASATHAENDDLLVAELREAFGPGSRGLKRPTITLDTPPPEEAHGTETAEGRQPPTARSASIPIGSTIGDFEILSELGRGGMGIVYRARQVSLDRHVALKILPGATFRSGQAIYRFRREAQAAARLNHENVVPVYAQGEYEGSYYYAMKLVDGVGLDSAIRDRPELLSSTFVARAQTPGSWLRSFPPLEPGQLDDGPPSEPEEAHVPIRRTAEDYRLIARMLAGVAEGLAHAHANGVLHRDIKPSNLLLGEAQRLFIADFGLAYLDDEPHVTVTGEVMGTPAYLAPEQISGSVEALDHRADIYSVGVTLYELLTGRRPFTGSGRDQILHAICTATPSAPRSIEPAVPIDLETICLRAMEREPDRRYPTATALAEDLSRFADGRHILSRRVSLLEKTLRWVRNHKTLSLAILMTLAAVAATAGWSWSVERSRLHEANRLLDGAYDALVHRDYHNPERVTPDIAQAAELGATGAKVQLAWALAQLGEDQNESAVARLSDVLAEDPNHIEARYLLAWAYWRLGEREQSRSMIALAEEAGPPPTAQAWFFRGLAVHFDRPEEAITSYRQACLLRAARQEFFPQATLHLARAHNQRMYATRTIDSLSEADLNLRQLADQGHYSGVPYYLLSIAHRLAGEIYRGSAGVRGDEQAQHHFDEALFWARSGREKYPESDRPLAAESSCLEQLGRYEESIEARSLAIERADTTRKRCEGLHFRWRLHYWLGHYDKAMEDVTAHAACMPDSPFYAHVYPALVLAEQDNLDGAIEHAYALVDKDAPMPIDIVWSASLLRLLGQSEDANDVLTAYQPDTDDKWSAALLAFCRGDKTLSTLEALASESDKPWANRGEVCFHAAVLALDEGDRDAALGLFGRSYRSFDSALGYSFHAKLILERMAGNPVWPPWRDTRSADGANVHIDD